MDNLCRSLMLGGSAVALLAAGAGAARAQNADNSNIEQVEVSASRISIQGYEAPTPVTVVGTEQLQRDAHTDIGDSIRLLPSVGQSDSPNNGGHSNDAGQGDAGISDVNLRNLGVLRTLVLFDGQRVVTSNPLGGGVDLSTIPTGLVERIDVVTGGASASWGSDAVAGVVNLVLNKTYTGLKGFAGFEDSSQNDHRVFKGEVTWGTDFAGSRGHLILSGDYTMSPDAVFYSQRDWWNPVTLVPGPAGGPKYVHQGNIGSAQYTQGGLITHSAAGTSAPADALRGIQFTGPNGQPAPFNFGTIVGSNCYDCSATKWTDIGQYSLIAVPYHNTTLFGYASYKLTDTIRASIQLNYGQNFEENTAADRHSAVTIQADNAFIPPAIAAQMQAQGIPSFTLSTNNTNNMDPFHPSIDGLMANCCFVLNLNTRQLMRGVFTLDGTLGEDWSWSAYAQHSQIRERQHDPNNTLTANYNNAVDAVRDPATGNIVCRSTLTDPTNGCVPLNLFGNGVASQAALDYIQPGRNHPGIADQATFLMNQDVFSGEVQGTLPWHLPAGAVAVAFGAEYRHEQQTNLRDPMQYGAVAAWGSGNFSQFQAQYNVEEGFLEIDAPILKNDIVESLDAQLAGRITSYSTSGMVETWKLGLTSQVNDDVKLRMTWSEDIRAPIISELFAPAQYNRGVANDLHNNNVQTNIYYTAQGNPDLVPEEANTISGGIVLTPSFIENLSLSFDWYSISIHKAIFTPTNGQIENQCFANVAVYCGQMFYGNGIAGQTAVREVDGNGVVANVPNFPIDYNGALNFILNVPLNAATETTSGLDVQGDYRMELFTGVLDWHLVANYNDERTRTALGQTLDNAGILGGDAPYAGGVPKFHMTLAAYYGDGPWELGVQGRFISSARLVGDDAATAGSVLAGMIDDNSVPWVAYLDLRASYKWNDNIQLYGAIDNTTNTPPPNIPSTSGASTTNLEIYDGLGRAYRVGIRFNF